MGTKTAPNSFISSVTDSDQNNKMVLIADDDPSNRVILSKIVALHGYKVLEAHNGQMALDLYEKTGEI